MANIINKYFLAHRFIVLVVIFYALVELSLPGGDPFRKLVV